MDKDIVLKIYLWAILNCIQNIFFQEESGRGGMSRQLHMVWPTSWEKWESGGQLWVKTNNTSFNIWLRFQKTIVQSPSQCSATRYKKVWAWCGWSLYSVASTLLSHPPWSLLGQVWWVVERPVVEATALLKPLSPLELHLPQFHHDGGNWYKHQKLYISVSVKCNYGTGCKKFPLEVWIIKCLFCNSWTWFQ